MASEFQRSKIARETDTSEMFTLLDLNQDGYLSRSEFTGHWTEFWAGDNPAAPGSWVFGSFPIGVSHG